MVDKKLSRMKSVIGGCGSAVIAFSGGVDSSVVCAVAHEVLGNNVVAVTAVSPTYPPREMEVAKKVAEQIGIKHMIITTDELEDKNFTKNPAERCYYCKSELLRELNGVRKKSRFEKIFDGTNSDDFLDFRPGLRAVKEFEVLSPLALAGMTKEDVRKLALRLGLPNADKPANPCLASRIPFGQKITRRKLQRIAKGEEFLQFLGFRVVRVRDYGDLAKVEVEKDELKKARKLEGKICAALKKLGYARVEINPRGYRMGGANEFISDVWKSQISSTAASSRRRSHRSGPSRLRRSSVKR